MPSFQSPSFQSPSFQSPTFQSPTFHARCLLRPAALLLLLAAASARAEDAKPKLDDTNRDYDQVDLKLDLDLDLEAGTLTGTATHTLAALKDDLRVVRMHLEDMQVTSATADGAACTVAQADGLLTVTLDRPRKKDEPLVLTIGYGGKPTSGLWFFKPTPEHPEVPLQVYTQGEGEENRHWFPCYDLPDDRLTTSVRVTVPAGLQTLSNGHPGPTETLADGRVAHTWTLDRPHPSYLVTLVVGTFHDHVRDAAGVEQHDLVPPEWKDQCDEVFGRTADMMGFFQDYTAQPFPWGRYSQVCVWDFMWGGMENTGATTLNMRALHGPGVRPEYTADGLVAHELAHDWFGDLMTCRTWNHIWLNEGFATYMTDLWVEHSQGPDAYAAASLGEQDSYMNGMDLKALAQKQRPASKSDCGDLEQHQYVKGASVLHMLRGLYGPERLRDGIRRYVAANHDRAVVSEDLRAGLEAAVGEDLSWFFDQWVYGYGFPELDVKSAWDAKDGAFHVRVAQTQPVSESLPLFRTPVDVEVVWQDGRTERRRIDLYRQSHDWRIPGPGAPKRFLFDPDGTLLARIRETKDRAAWDKIATDPSAPLASRVRAIRALADKGPDAVPALARAASSDTRFEVRSEACTALGKVGGDTAAAALTAATKDADGRVRRSAVNALGNLPAALAAAPLTACIRSDASVYVVADAAAALGKVKADGAFDVLVAALARDRRRDQIRQRVMDGLKDLGDPRGAEIARGYLDYSWGKGIQHQLRKSALDAVCTLAPRAPETKAALLSLLSDPYFRMKSWAAETCADLQIEEAAAQIEANSKEAIGPGVKESAKAQLARLRGKKNEAPK